MTKMEPRVTSRSAYLIPLIAIGLVITLLCRMNVLAFESEGWVALTRPFQENPSFSSFWDALKIHELYQWHYDNIRFMQVVGFLLFYFPTYISDIAAGASVVWMLYEMARLIGVWRRDMILYTLCIGLSLFLLPWYNVDLSTVWILNYTLVTAVWAYTMRRWLDCELSWAAAFGLGFMVSWMHELFAAMLLAQVVALCIFFPKYRTRASLTLVSGVCIPLVVAMSIPGTAYRVDTIEHHSALKWLAHNYMIIPFVITAAIVLSRSRFRRKSFNPLTLALGAGAIGGIIVSLKYGHTPRTAWGQTVCIILFVISCLLETTPRFSPNIKRTVTITVWLILAAQYSLTLAFSNSFYQLRALSDKDYDSLTGEYATRFVNYPKESRWLYIATMIRHEPTFSYDYLFDRNVFPIQLKNFTPDSAQVVKTNLPEATVYNCDGILALDGDSEAISNREVMHTLFSGNKSAATEIFCYNFENDYGKYVILHPHRRSRYSLMLNGAPVDSICFDLTEHKLKKNPWTEFLKNHQ